MEEKRHLDKTSQGAGIPLMYTRRRAGGNLSMLLKVWSFPILSLIAKYLHVIDISHGLERVDPVPADRSPCLDYVGSPLHRITMETQRSRARPP